MRFIASDATERKGRDARANHVGGAAQTARKLKIFVRCPLAMVLCSERLLEMHRYVKGYTVKLRVAFFCMLLQVGPAFAEAPLLSLPSFPDFFIAGVGAGPQYIGSDHNVWAVAPAGQLNFGRRYVSLQANYLSINLVNDPNWSAGPAGILRFGRRDVEDEQVNELPEIPMSIGLGGFVGYSFAGGPDPRNRWRIGAGALYDVSGAHEGYVLDANIRRWLPVGQYAALGVGVAASWASNNYMDTYFTVDAEGSAASGLPIYSAGAGGETCG